MKTLEEMEEDYFDDYEGCESKMFDTCPKCYRPYDEIDYEFQLCHFCGWDSENEEWTHKTR
ncbi:MAG TPA: hypothetical protein VK207_08935 [Bacteroidales bacterium]|nr:hypothetical protein [Bacteroidales bacterium]